MKYIHPMRHAKPESLVGQVYAQIRHDFGIVGDPFRLHSSVPELTAGMWSIVRETTIVGQVHWSLKEAVAAAVSHSNACPYCVDIHASLARLPYGQSLADLIKQDRTADITDPILRSVVTWALSSGSPDAVLRLSPPFSEQEVSELIGVAIAYHYINRMVNVFLPESLLPPLLRGGWFSNRIWGRIGQKLAHGRDQTRSPGTSLRFLPEAELPAELSWAAASPSMSRAFAGWAALIEQKGAEILSPEVRLLATEQLALWKGVSPALGRAWVESAVAEFTRADRAAGRLVLLTALASYQIDEQVIEAFRAYYPTDAQLVGAVAWASAAAARRIASWLEVRTSPRPLSNLDAGPGH